MLSMYIVDEANNLNQKGSVKIGQNGRGDRSTVDRSFSTSEMDR
jgi:hypothetical protein